MALIIAAAINACLFFGANTHHSSSFSCKGQGCQHRGLFHWVNQSWLPTEARVYTFGLVVSGPMALVVRVLSIAHWSLACAM
jgi:hypothetical protein